MAHTEQSPSLRAPEILHKRNLQARRWSHTNGCLVATRNPSLLVTEAGARGEGGDIKHSSAPVDQSKQPAEVGSKFLNPNGLPRTYIKAP
jgi:hypothetical protein